MSKPKLEDDFNRVSVQLKKEGNDLAIYYFLKQLGKKKSLFIIHLLKEFLEVTGLDSVDKIESMSRDEIQLFADLKIRGQGLIALDTKNFFTEEAQKNKIRIDSNEQSSVNIPKNETDLIEHSESKNVEIKNLIIGLEGII